MQCSVELVNNKRMNKMGGNLLPYFDLPIRRANRDEYCDITNEVQKLFDLYFRLELIPSYRQKDSFGDADFIVQTENGKDHTKVIADLLKTKIYHNGETVSFPFREFQIDFICVRPEWFDISKTYFSWNDLGNLMGRIYHGGLGLQYGHQGLIYKIRESNFLENTPDSQCHIVDEITLSLNPREIFEIAEFDFDEFQAGFETLEDIYVWVAKNKFFNPDKFSFENMNNANKTRNKKRVVYNSFLVWLDKHKDEFKSHEFFEDKLNYLPMILERFPFLQGKIDDARQKFEHHQFVKSKFNGNLIREITGLEGAELGKFIVKFKNSFTDFDSFIVDAPTEVIRQKIHENFNSWNG